MGQIVIDKILLSINQLEEAINTARQSIENSKLAHPELLGRLDCYTKVVAKQRLLVNELKYSSQAQDWDETRRLATLIRHSSQFIAGEMQSVIAVIRTALSERSYY